MHVKGGCLTYGSGNWETFIVVVVGRCVVEDSVVASLAFATIEVIVEVFWLSIVEDSELSEKLRESMA